MEKTKLLTIAVIGLLILNIGTLVFIGLGHKRPPHDMHRPDRNGPPNAAEFLIHELNFDANQTAAYEQLRMAHRKTRDSLQEVLRSNQKAFFDGLAMGDTSKIDAVTTTQRQMEMITFNHFKDVRALCKTEQQSKFDNIIQEVLRIMASNRPQQPHDGPH